MLKPVLITAPNDTPVSLAEAKTHLNEESTEFDAKITRMIQSATQYLDGGMLGRCIVTQTWRQDYPGFGRLKLPFGAVKSIDSIKYYDRDNAQQTLADSVYTLETEDFWSYVTLAPDQEWPNTYPRLDAVSVTFTAGDAVPEVPETIKSAILFALERDYDPINHERVRQLQEAHDRLVNSIRPIGL